MKDKTLVTQFILDTSVIYQNGGFEGWLADFFLKSKADQEAEYQIWIADRTLRIEADIGALEAQKIARQDTLNAELSKAVAETTEK